MTPAENLPTSLAPQPSDIAIVIDRISKGWRMPSSLLRRALGEFYCRTYKHSAVSARFDKVKKVPCLRVGENIYNASDVALAFPEFAPSAGPQDEKQ